MVQLPLYACYGCNRICRRWALFPRGSFGRGTLGRGDFCPGGLLSRGAFVRGSFPRGTFVRGAYARSPQIQCMFALGLQVSIILGID